MTTRVRSYQDLISRFRSASRALGADMASIGQFDSSLGSYDLYKICFTRGGGSQSVCISSGMHGDEPAAVEGLLRGLELIAREGDSLDASFTIFPCDNPTGYELNTRENWQGLDLNREFQKLGQAPEIAIVEQELGKASYDLTFDLHEDIDTYGIYLYERVRHGGRPIAHEIIGRIRNAGYPVDEDEWIEGMPASGGVIWPGGRMRESELPKAVYLWQSGCRHLITTETPGKLDLETRTKMQMVCFQAVLDLIREGGLCPGDQEAEQHGNSNDTVREHTT